MLEKAIEKLNSEMSKNNNSYVQVVGQFLLQHLEANPESAEKILQEGKTILKSLDEMKKAAEKKKVGNCAVLTDQEGFEIVLKYFGIEGQEVNINPTVTELKTDIIETTKAPEHKEIDFNVSLDDFLK